MRIDVEAVTLWAADRLLAGSLQGAVVIALVWIACRRIPRVPASVQAALWWVAALKLVVALLPVPALPIPLLPAGDADVLRAETAKPGPAAVPVRALEGTGAARPPAHVPTVTPWRTALIGVWLVVLALQAVRLILERRSLRAVVRRAVPRTGEDAVVVARLAAAIGLTRVPQVRESDEIAGPQVAGVRRPIVLVPAGCRTTLTPEERAMALCHELVHVRRHDLALGWVPALAERLFFFHPLARLMAREYLATREAACDAAVVRALGVSPKEYGRLLVRLGVAGAAPAFAAGGSAFSVSSLRRRLDMLQHTASAGASRRSLWCLATVTFLAVMPFQLVAGTPSGQAPVPAAPPIEVSVPVAPQAASPASPVPPAGSAAPPASLAPAHPAPPQNAPPPPQDRDDVARLGDATTAEQQAIDERHAEIERLSRTIAALEGTLRTLAARREPAEDERIRSLMAQLGAAQESLQGRTREMMESMREVAERRGQAPLVAAPRPLVLVPQETPGAPIDQRMLTQQLEQLARQQQALSRQQQDLARQQETLTRMQRQLSDESVRMREALDRALAALRSELRSLRPPD